MEKRNYKKTFLSVCWIILAYINSYKLYHTFKQNHENMFYGRNQGSSKRLPNHINWNWFSNILGLFGICAKFIRYNAPPEIKKMKFMPKRTSVTLQNVPKKKGLKHHVLCYRAKWCNMCTTQRVCFRKCIHRKGCHLSRRNKHVVFQST